MLAPLQDYLRPMDLKSSSLLCTTKECYFARMPVEFDLNQPEFEDAQWIVYEDVNVEHLIDIFTSVDPDSNEVWDACTNFIRHLEWYKQRQTVLRPKVEALPDDHRSKPECLLNLAMLSGSVGNFTEQARLLGHVLGFERERKNEDRVALTLEMLSAASRMLGLGKEGIDQTKESLEIYELLGDTLGRARCLEKLARLLYDDGQFNAAEEAAVRSNKLLPEKGQEYCVCRSHRTLGYIHRSKGEREMAIHHYKVALRTASSFNWHSPLFWTNFSLAELFLAERELEDARAHLEQAKLHALNGPYLLGRAAHLQATILLGQHRPEEATSETLHAIEIFEKVGTLKEADACRILLQDIERGQLSVDSISSGELLEIVLCPIPNDPPLSAHDASP